MQRVEPTMANRTDPLDIKNRRQNEIRQQTSYKLEQHTNMYPVVLLMDSAKK